jgi:dTDP-4-amino-4,6-dideoxygalactose transaminase
MIPLSKPYIGEEEKRKVMEVLDSGYIVQGPRTAEFEQRFAEVCGTKHAIATSSGTTALHLALLAHGIGPGDEVITTPFTFIASANSILFAGARPVYADIREEDFNIDPEQVERAITPRTKAIMPVHLFGQMADMDALQAIAEAHNLVIIEDACQAIDASYKGQKAGSMGGAGAFSLYASKNIMSAEGGMVTTNSDDIAARCRLLRNHGMDQRYHYEMLGYNFRMTDLHAALGLAQIGRLADFTARRQANAAYLNEHIHAVQTPLELAGREHAWHQYTIRVGYGQNREASACLNEAGIGTGIFYPIPAHQHAYMKEIVGEVSLPVAERLSQEVVSLPVHPLLSEAELATIANEVNKL